MEPITLNFQFAAFGNYAQITPEYENNSYFLKVLQEKGIANSVSFYETNTNSLGVSNGLKNRLSFISDDQSFQVRFASNRMDILMTNWDIGKTKTLDKANFIRDVQDIMKYVDSKFSVKNNRIGLVSQHLLKLPDAKLLIDTNIQKLRFFQKEDKFLEVSNRLVVSTNVQIPEPVKINVTSEYKWQKIALKENDEIKVFDSAIFTIDINSLQNEAHSFDLEKSKAFLEHVSLMESEIKNDLILI